MTSGLETERVYSFNPAAPPPHGCGWQLWYEARSAVWRHHHNLRQLWNNTETQLQLKGSVKEPNIWIYFFFFCPSLNGVLFPMFCLLVEGECQILVKY